MRAIEQAGLLGCALALTACNVLTQAQTGPVLVSAAKEAHPGGEGSVAVFLDVKAGETWVDCHFNGGSCTPPEMARRAGLKNSIYVRGTNLGLAMGMDPGYFVGSTDATRLLLGSISGRFGFERLSGSTYGTVGGAVALTAGLPIHKAYDPRALVLCRSLTYLTASLQGAIEYLPASPAVSTLPSVSLLFGVVSFGDSGAPSDYGPSQGTCPR